MKAQVDTIGKVVQLIDVTFLDEHVFCNGLGGAFSFVDRAAECRVFVEHHTPKGIVIRPRSIIVTAARGAEALAKRSMGG